MQLLTSIHVALMALINQFVRNILWVTVIHTSHVICTEGGVLCYIGRKRQPLPSVTLRLHDSLFIYQIITQPKDLLRTSVLNMILPPSESLLLLG